LSTFTVANTADGGAGSLRQAILDANASGGILFIDHVEFNIPGTGLHTIRPLSPLPTVTGRLVIDGFTQPGSAANTLASADNALRRIELDGSLLTGAGHDGLTISAGSSTVRGLIIEDFTGDGITLTTQDRDVIEGCLLAGNGGSGVSISGPSSANHVGGTTPSARNLMSSNGTGIDIAGSGSTGNVVQGNFIGIDNTRTADRGNRGSGIAIRAGAADNSIGGTSAGAGNVIAFNGIGIRIDSGTGNAILSNAIFANNALGIDLLSNDQTGVTANDHGDKDQGPNNLQNFPVIFLVIVSGGNTHVAGSLDSLANTSYTLQFFASASADASGTVEGETYLGSFTVTTSAVGVTGYAVTLPGTLPAGQLVTATATDSDNNTSEFSAVAIVNPVDVGVALSSNYDGALIHDTVTYTLTVSNAGPRNASAVVVTDDLHVSGSTLVVSSLLASQGSAAQSGNTITWNAGILEAASTATLTIAATLVSRGTLRQSVQVSSAEYDANPSNDQVAAITAFGTAYAYLVNGFGGCCIPPQVQSHLEAKGAIVHVSNWNDIDQHGNPGDLDPTDFTIRGADPSTDQNFVNQMGTAIHRLDPALPLILIGHSFGGDAVLEVAQENQDRRMDFLGVLDPVGRGALRANVTGYLSDPVPASVAYFFNRWEQPLPASIGPLGVVTPLGWIPLEGPPPPLDFFLSGHLLSNAQQNNQAKQNNRRDAQGHTIHVDPFNIVPAVLTHVGVPNDTYIQKQMNHILDARIFNPNPFIVSAHAVAGNPGLTIDGVEVTFNEPIDPASFNPADIITTPSPVSGVAPVAGSGNRQFLISFDPIPRLAPPLDHRQLVVGPDVRDADQGNRMDQDRDGTPGETIDDRFTFNFGTGQAVVGPQIDDIVFEFLHDAAAALQRVSALDLVFTEDLDPATATNLAFYRVIAAGKDNLLGTADDQVIALHSATYDPDARTVTLTPSTPLEQNTVFQVTVNRAEATQNAPGVTDLAGNAIDGDGDGHPGGAFALGFSRGSILAFLDANGDRANLALTRGGLIDSRFGAGGAVQSLALLGTMKNQSVLSGTVVKPRIGGDGSVTLGVPIVGIEGVKNTLPHSIVLSPSNEIPANLGDGIGAVQGLGAAVDAANALLADPWAGLAQQTENDVQDRLAALEGKFLDDTGVKKAGRLRWSFSQQLRNVSGSLDIAAPPGIRSASLAGTKTDGLTMELPLSGSWGFQAAATLHTHMEIWDKDSPKHPLFSFSPDLSFGLGIGGLKVILNAILDGTERDRPRVTKASVTASFTITGSGITPLLIPLTLTAEIQGGVIKLRALLPSFDVQGLDAIHGRITDGEFDITLTPEYLAAVAADLGDDQSGDPGIADEQLEVSLHGKLAIRQALIGSASFPFSYTTSHQLPAIDALQVLQGGLPITWGENQPLGKAAPPERGVDLLSPAKQIEDAIIRHMPFDTILSINGPAAAIDAPKGVPSKPLPGAKLPGLQNRVYGVDADSALWTGTYLAAEAFRSAATNDPAAIDRMNTLLDGLQRLFDVTTDAAVVNGQVFPVTAPGIGVFARVASPSTSILTFLDGPLSSRRAYYERPEGGWKIVGDTQARTFPNYLAATQALAALPPVTGIAFKRFIVPVGTIWYGWGLSDEHPLSRDQYSGVTLGLTFAYELAADPGVRERAKALIEKILDNLIANHWNVILPPENRMPFSSSFLGNFDKQLAFLRIGKTVDPDKYGARYDAVSAASGLVWLPAFASALDPIFQYYKFNLQHDVLAPTLFLETDPALRANYMDAYNLLWRAVGAHQNAYFDLLHILVQAPADRAATAAGPGPSNSDLTLGTEIKSLLGDWLKRTSLVPGASGVLPRDDVADPLYQANLWPNHVAVFTSITGQLRMASTYVLPVWGRLGVGMDFAWQKQPFEVGYDVASFLTGTKPTKASVQAFVNRHTPTLEGPGVDYLIAYWLAAFLQVA
jgi:uncharacterized repeat protein (TIGR01451 family)